MDDCNADVVYLLDSVVEFRPAAGTLTSRLNARVISLHAPSSHCLHKLIAQRYQVISQSELITAGWPDTHDKVTPNTFYQTILSLRRGLAEAGVSERKVKTISRKGLRLSETLKVEDISNIATVESTVCHENETVSGASVQDKKNNRGNLNSYFFMMIAGIAVVTFTTWWLYKVQERQTLFEHYIFFNETRHGCKIYLNADANEYKKHEIALPALPLKCDNLPFVYISTFKASSKMSVIRCSDKIWSSRGVKCVSTFYIHYN